MRYLSLIFFVSCFDWRIYDTMPLSHFTPPHTFFFLFFLVLGWSWLHHHHHRHITIHPTTDTLTLCALSSVCPSLVSASYLVSYYTTKSLNCVSFALFKLSFVHHLWITRWDCICNCQEDVVLAYQIWKLGRVKLVDHHGPWICQNQLFPFTNIASGKPILLHDVKLVVMILWKVKIFLPEFLFSWGSHLALPKHVCHSCLCQ